MRARNIAAVTLGLSGAGVDEVDSPFRGGSDITLGVGDAVERMLTYGVENGVVSPLSDTEERRILFESGL